MATFHRPGAESVSLNHLSACPVPSAQNLTGTGSPLTPPFMSSPSRTAKVKNQKKGAIRRDVCLASPSAKIGTTSKQEAPPWRRPLSLCVGEANGLPPAASVLCWGPGTLHFLVPSCKTNLLLLLLLLSSTTFTGAWRSLNMRVSHCS